MIWRGIMEMRKMICCGIIPETTIIQRIVTTQARMSDINTIFRNLRFAAFIRLPILYH